MLGHGVERGPNTLAVGAVASMIAVAFMGSVIVSPLYSLYQRKFGFSEITLTLVYATYVVGNVAALVFFGQISDQVGRKRVSLPTLALAMAAAVVFLFATGTIWLFAGRLLFGLVAGVLAGTGTAWLAEQYGEQGRPRATLVAATANLVGIALGPLIGGLLAAYAPWPLELPFLAYIAMAAVVAIAVSRTAETREPSIGRISDLRIRVRIGVPRERVGAFATPAVTGFVIFALAGLYFALIPGILIHDLHESNVALGGGTVFELGLFGAVCVLLARSVGSRSAMTAGLVLLLPAAALVVSAQAADSLPLLLIATSFAGVALALGYRGSLETINQIAPDDRRAQVVSSYFIACFVGNSIPVIGVGVLSSLAAPLTASIAFTCTVALLSLAALAWQSRRVFRRRSLR
jgi:predicted MFS family arabinose efflux permease